MFTRKANSVIMREFHRCALLGKAGEHSANLYVSWNGSHGSVYVVFERNQYSFYQPDGSVFCCEYSGYSRSDSQINLSGAVTFKA